LYDIEKSFSVTTELLSTGLKMHSHLKSQHSQVCRLGVLLGYGQFLHLLSYWH